MIAFSKRQWVTGGEGVQSEDSSTATRRVHKGYSVADNFLRRAPHVQARRREVPQDLSLVLGGPLFQLLRRAQLSGNALELLRQRIFVISLLACLPLLVLPLVEGHALRGSVTVPFLWDVDVHLRFLLALPLLIVAELVVHQRMRFDGEQFRRSADNAHCAYYEAVSYTHLTLPTILRV